TAPNTVPTAATPASGGPAVNAAGIVTIYVFSKVDNHRIAQGAITIIKGGPITFSGISPLAVPQGGPFVDIFIAASNMTSQTGVKITRPDGPQFGVDPALTNQTKWVLATGSSTTSIGARVRLLPDPNDLHLPGTYTVDITPSGTSTVTGGPFSFDLVPVAPSLIGVSPDN